jgi:hypothetical protein
MVHTENTVPTVSLLLCHAGVVRTAQKTPFQQCFCCCVTQVPHGPRTERRFQVSPLVRVRNLLPSNGRCLQSHYLATGLHATVFSSVHQHLFISNFSGVHFLLNISFLNTFRVCFLLTREKQVSRSLQKMCEIFV